MRRGRHAGRFNLSSQSIPGSRPVVPKRLFTSTSAFTVESRWDRFAGLLMEGFGYHLTTKGKGWNISGVRLWFCKPSLWILVITHSIIPPQLRTHSWSFIARVEVECMPLLGVQVYFFVFYRPSMIARARLAIWMPDTVHYCSIGDTIWLFECQTVCRWF